MFVYIFSTLHSAAPGQEGGGVGKTNITVVLIAAAQLKRARCVPAVHVCNTSVTRRAHRHTHTHTLKHTCITKCTLGLSRLKRPTENVWPGPLLPNPAAGTEAHNRNLLFSVDSKRGSWTS